MQTLTIEQKIRTSPNRQSDGRIARHTNGPTDRQADRQRKEITFAKVIDKYRRKIIIKHTLTHTYICVILQTKGVILMRTCKDAKRTSTSWERGRELERERIKNNKPRRTDQTNPVSREQQN